MILFAEIDANGWAFILTAAISAAGVIAVQLLTLYLKWKSDERIAAEVKKVAAVQAEDVAKVAKKADAVAVNVAKVAEVQAVAAQDVKDVKDTLAASNEAHEAGARSMDGKLDVIHDLVNNDMHKALSVAADATERLAKATGKAEDIADAKGAADKLANHDARQALADRNKAAKP